MVVLVSSSLAHHAIILRPSGDVFSIPLTHVEASWLVDSGTSWRSAVSEARTTLRERLKIAKSMLPRARRTTLEDTLRRIWVVVVKPVLDALGLEVRMSYNGDVFMTNVGADSPV